MLPRRSSRTATTAAASKNWITEYKEKSDRANYITTGNGEKKQNDRHFKLRAWLARTVSAARDPRLYGGRGKSTGVWKVAGRTRFTAKSQVKISDWEHTDDREKSTVRGRRLNALRDISLLIKSAGCAETHKPWSTAAAGTSCEAPPFFTSL